MNTSLSIDPLPFTFPQRQTLFSDLIAGLTGAVAGAPQAMAFAIIAGLNPIYGLYSAAIGTFIGAFTTSSDFMTVAPTNALSLILASTLLQPDTDPLASLVVITFLVAVFQIAFGLLRFGNLTRFVSQSVMRGFITGAGLLILLGQLPELTGYEAAHQSLPILQAWDWLTHLSHSDMATAALGGLAVAVIAGIKTTRFSSIATLVAIVLTGLWVQISGWEVALVRDLGQVPSGLPRLMWPDPSLMPQLATGALAMAVLAVVQGAAISQNIMRTDGSRPDMSRDFTGQGLANLASSFVGGMPLGGSLSRTAVNISAGARTRVANALAGLAVLAMLLVSGQLIGLVPLAALAGHLVVVAAELVDVKNLKKIWQVNWTGRSVMVITLVSTLVLPVQYSIYVGIVLSLLLYLYTSTQQTQVVELVPKTNHQYAEKPVPENLPSRQPVLLSIYGDLGFAAAEVIEGQLPTVNGAENPVVVLRMRGIEDMDITAIVMLERYADTLAARGGRLILCGVGPQAVRQLSRTGAYQRLGADNIFTEKAVIFEAAEEALTFAEHWLADAPRENGS